MTITILPRAKADVRSAAEWYELRKPGLGDEFADAIEEGLQWIASSPLANSQYEMLPEETTIRRYRLPRFPYLIIFELSENSAITVIAVAHTRRKPNYWRSKE